MTQENHDSISVHERPRFFTHLRVLLHKLGLSYLRKLKVGSLAPNGPAKLFYHSISASFCIPDTAELSMPCIFAVDFVPAHAARRTDNHAGGATISGQKSDLLFRT